MAALQTGQEGIVSSDFIEVLVNIRRIYLIAFQIVFLTYNGWVMAKGQPNHDVITMATQRLTDAGIKTHFVHKYIKPK